MDPEPNGNPATKQFVDEGTQTCGDPASVFSGTLLDGSDDDWFVYYGAWICGTTNTPDHVISVDAGDVSLCAYMICPGPNGQVVNCTSGTPDENNGFPGCCDDDLIIADVDCEDTDDDSAFAYVEVTSGDAVCEHYDIHYEVVDG